MSLFRILSILGIGGAVGLCVLHYLVIGRRMPHPGHGRRGVLRYNLWERFLHLVLLAAFLVLLVTGFWAVIVHDGRIAGYMLMIHTTCGAVFAVAVAAMLVTWAADHAFADPDRHWLCGGGCCSTRARLPAGRFNAGDKIYFWLAGLLTLILLLSMLLSMVDLFGPTGQDLLLLLHRAAAIVLVVVTIWHAYCTTLIKPGGLTAILRGRVSTGWALTYHPLWGGRPEVADAEAEPEPEEVPAD